MPKSSQISLYEAIDLHIWRDDPDGVSGTNRFITSAAPVLVLNVNNSDQNTSQLGVEIPDVLCLDRYMLENQETIFEMRRQMQDAFKDIEEQDAAMAALQTNPSQGQTNMFGTLEMITSAITYLSHQSSSSEEFDDEDVDLLNDEGFEQSRTLATRLERFFTKIKDKYELLEQARNSAQRRHHSLSNFFKPESSAPEHTEGFKHKYYLRGVCTKANVVFLPMPADDGSDIWWRIEYEPIPRVDRRVSICHPSHGVFR